MEASRFAVAALYAVMLIFVFFGAAHAADAPTPTPEAGAGSIVAVPALFTSVVAFFAYILF